MRSSLAVNLGHAFLTIENGGSFLESAVLGLNDEEVAEYKFEAQPGDVHQLT